MYILIAIMLLIVIIGLIIMRLAKSGRFRRGTLFITASLLILIAFFCYSYQKNFWLIGTNIDQLTQKVTQNDKGVKKRYTNDHRQIIKNMVMRQAVKGFDKQGFIAIPSLSILEPIYNDAYSTAGLNNGAAYANRSAQDPTGRQQPIMGQGNYGLAAHNFNDGKTGFSALQEYRNVDAPYLKNGKMLSSKWLNGTKVYLANQSGIYVYTVTKQETHNKNDIAVLNNTKQPRVTIVSCLFPSTDYRIITTAKLQKELTWQQASDKIISYFDLEIRDTNTHADWFNPGAEEGANGDSGGTVKV